MTTEVWSVQCNGPGLVLPINQHLVHYLDNRANERTPCEAYQRILEVSTADVIVYAHDDLTIHDPDWLYFVNVILKREPHACTVGFGGATSLGHPDMYKRPYDIGLMARGGYASNSTDWRAHGDLSRGTRRCAVLDAYFMAVRRDFLVQVGGWPTGHLTHHCLDLWLACEAARYKKEIWQVGVSCTHHGGGTSVTHAYRSAKWLQGGTLKADHEAPHRWLYESYADVLPIKV